MKNSNYNSRKKIGFQADAETVNKLKQISDEEKKQIKTVFAEAIEFYVKNTNK